MRVRGSTPQRVDFLLTTDYVYGPMTGEGLGTFIFDSDDAFSVFAFITLVAGRDSAQTLEVYSGRIIEGGIDDFHIALFMLDNAGSSPPFIPNGTGRVGRGDDGFSPRISELPSASVTASTITGPDRAKGLPV